MSGCGCITYDVDAEAVIRGKYGKDPDALDGRERRDAAVEVVRLMAELWTRKRLVVVNGGSDELLYEIKERLISVVCNVECDYIYDNVSKKELDVMYRRFGSISALIYILRAKVKDEVVRRDAESLLAATESYAAEVMSKNCYFVITFTPPQLNTHGEGRYGVPRYA